MDGNGPTRQTRGLLSSAAALSPWPQLFGDWVKSMDTKANEAVGLLNEYRALIGHAPLGEVDEEYAMKALKFTVDRAFSLNEFPALKDKMQALLAAQ